MKLKAFTIIELLISIALTGLIFAYLYSSIYSISNSNDFYEKKINDFEKKNQLVVLLYNDILLSNGLMKKEIGDDKNTSQDTPKGSIGQATQEDEEFESVFVESSDVSYVSMKSKNSIKGYLRPYVSYVFFRKEKLLYRLESKKKIQLPLSEEEIVFIKYNKFVNIDEFNIYQKYKDFLVFYSVENRVQFFEISRL